jgi:uncharacterized membrane protein YagU involved in acid resistance
MKKSIATSIIKAGLLAGFLDIIAACTLFSIRSGNDPMIVLRFIASGALGPDAMNGGWESNLLGLLFHFIIAFGWTILFFLLYPKLSGINWITLGLLYGVVVWLLMNLLILPMTKIAQRPFDLSQAIIGTLILMIAIGLPISYVCSRHFSRAN